MNKSTKMFEAINGYCGKDTPLATACSELFSSIVLEADVTPTTINQVDVNNLPPEAIKELSAEASQIASDKEKLEQDKAALSQESQQMVEKITGAAQQAEQDQQESPDNREVNING